MLIAKSTEFPLEKMKKKERGKTNRGIKGDGGEGKGEKTTTQP